MKRIFWIGFLLLQLSGMIGPTGCTQGSDWRDRGYRGPRWWIESAKLTSDQRDKLADMTPGCNCPNSTWDAVALRWKEDFGRRKGPHAILPWSEAVAQQKADQEDSLWCDPKTDLGYSNGWQQYRCVSDSRSPHQDRQGRWEINAEAEQEIIRLESRKDQLALAMTTRLLTNAEFREALEYGSQLLVHPMHLYMQDDIDKRFEHMVRIQEELRLER